MIAHEVGHAILAWGGVLAQGLLLVVALLALRTKADPSVVRLM